MFDKTVKNTYTKKFWAASVTTLLIFAYTPSAIADPISTFAPNISSPQEEVLQASEDEDPASVNQYFEPTTLTEQIILAHANELGLDAFLLQEQLFAFTDLTKHVESDGKRYATNAYSGAMSYYQFLPSSVITAVNRLENVMGQHGMGRVPSWASRVHKDPFDIYSLSAPEQRLLVIVNIIEQDRSDDYILKLGSGNNELAKDIYYKFHHTAPDSYTKSRVESLYSQYFPKTI